MEQNIRIFGQIDYVNEAFALLNSLAEETESEFGSLEKAFASLEETVFVKYAVDSDYVRKALSLSEELVLGAKRAFAEEMDEVRACYGRLEKSACPAELCLCIDRCNVGEYSQQNSEQVLAKYQACSEWKRDVYFLEQLMGMQDRQEFYRIVGYEKEGYPVTEAERVRNIISCIHNLDMKQDSRERIADLYLNRNAYVERMVALLEKAMAYLKKYETQMNALMGEWETYWNGSLADGSFPRLLNEIFVDGQENLKEGMLLVPEFIQCNSITFSIETNCLLKQEDMLPVARVGIIFSAEFGLNSKPQKQYEKDELQKLLKVIGDKTTFHILLFLKDKPAYGIEIAKQFELTTATVSHHMNKLAAQQLVQVDQKEGRIYYRTRIERLQEIFDKCKCLFE